MKFVIDKPGEGEVQLRFQPTSDGSLTVLARGDDGTPLGREHLVEFCADGRLFMYGGIGPRLGFDLDKEGHIKVANQVETPEPHNESQDKVQWPGLLPADEKRLLQLQSALVDILTEVLKRNFFGSATIEMTVQDGMIQSVTTSRTKAVT